MTGPDNVILRWARLKRASKAGHATDLSGNALPTAPVETAAAGAEALAAPDRTNAEAEQPFDLASLPSIEAITGNTDIRGFLQSQVPAELTRAALRQAWASDPAIRDFIGIAENQWDFNDPTAIPGFGPLSEADNLPSLLAQALGKRGNPAETILEAVSLEPSPSTVSDHQQVESDPFAEQAIDRSSANEGIRDLAEDGQCEGEMAEKRRIAEGPIVEGRIIGDVITGDRVVEGDGSPRKHRLHGSALPR